MDEYLNNRQKEIFHNLLANPADTGSAYASSLHELVRSYPQSGLFRALHARALNNDQNPTSAVAYFDSRALYKLYQQPDNLLSVDGGQVIFQPASTPATVTAPIEDKAPIAQPASAQPNTAGAVTEKPLDFPEVLKTDSWMHKPEEVKEDNTQPAHINTSTATPEAPKAEEPATPAITAEPAVLFEKPAEAQQAPAATPPPFTENRRFPPPPSVTAAAATETPYIAPTPASSPVEAKAETRIDEDVFDEITGIDDIEITQNPVESTAGAAKEQPVAEEKPPVRDEAEKLILGNIAATDYFVFDKAFSKAPAEPAATPAAQPEPQPAFAATPQEAPQPATEPAAEAKTHQDVSKYHDEKMPYTFMWWLDKTRKQHHNLYQPYTKAPVNSPVSMANKPVNDALQQQYFENIFHISSVDDLGNDAAAQTVEFDMQSKEDRIIQRFITEDPHIHPPVGEKLDTENKAKKSSEDNNEMVTETLARIYADQMLYPKAIATYKKLMLKYPEKSRYFASRIENLEKKTN